ncbi:four-carbon acid sugar kinase family protein [Microbacter sp. GSS18]|nr:four-carbon acid sugar kinase family protein [Microbacter sp. GSS18]
MTLDANRALAAGWEAGLPAETTTVADDVAAATPRSRRFVLLDDDPTGTQTVRDVPVLTAWEDDDIAWALDQDSPGFFILTNTRALQPDAAAARIREIVTAGLRVAQQRGIRLVFASRGDSTLRGHFPLETDVITDALRDAGRVVDAVVMTPAYIEAGRVTLDGIHWLRQKDGSLLPAARSEFARDATFGYRSSSLAAWVEEKSDGRIPAGSVRVISLDEIRGADTSLTGVLQESADGRVVVVDAVADSDQRAVAVAALAAEAAGTEIVYRVGPSFARAGLGQDSCAPIPDEKLARIAPHGSAHGLVAVGSHVPMTTRQLDDLLGAREHALFELDVERVLSDAGEAYLDDVAIRAADALRTSLVVVRTSRALRTGADAAESLAIATKVSAALVHTVRAIVARQRPAFVLAKGGITSSDIATDALGIRRAFVRGPLLPGIVSLWEAAGPASGLAYIVFAGNVGSDTGLTDVVERLEPAPGGAGLTKEG